MQVSALFLRALYLDLRDEGLLTDNFLRRFELKTQASQYALLEYSALEEAIHAAHGAGARPGLGLRLGAKVGLRGLGMFGQLLLQCPTLRHAFAAAQRFMPLLQHDGQLLMTESGAMAAVHYQSGLAPGPRNQFATEVALSLAVTVARRFVGEKVCPQGILLPYAAPEHRDAYDEVFRCPIVFKSHTTALIFDRALLEVEYPFADTFLREVFENELARVLVRAGRNVPLHFRLRAILERQHDTLDRQKLPDVSRMLGLSRRAIRRHLAAEGHSFSRILQSLRRDQAMRFLENVSMPIKDIAEAMGYSDPSAFHRAFRRWTGVTPRQFRLNLGEPARSDAA